MKNLSEGARDKCTHIPYLLSLYPLLFLFSLALCRFSLNCMFWDSFHTLACRGPLCLIYWPERCDFLVVSVTGASLEAGPRKGGGSKITKLGFPSYSSAPGDPFVSLLPERQSFSVFYLFLLLATDPL